VNEPIDPRPFRRSIDVDRDYFLYRMKGHAMRQRWDPTITFGPRRPSTADADMRVSDTERNEVAETLSRHFSEGRLDSAEFKERLDRAMGAKTRGDLRGLCDDLPTLRAPDTPKAAQHRHRRHRVMPFILVVLFLALVAGSFSPFAIVGHFTWVLWVLGGLFIWERLHRHRHHHHHSALE
jgi:hypothetical protein